MEHLTAQKSGIPLVTIYVPTDVWTKVVGMGISKTPENQLALADFGERVFAHANSGNLCSWADAAAMAMENWEDMFLRKSLRKIRPAWYLHPVLVGNQVLLRVGYWAPEERRDGPINEKLADETAWVFKDIANETWVDLFREDLRNEIILKHQGIDLLRVRFERKKKSF